MGPAPEGANGGSIIASLIPLLIFWLIFGILAFFIAREKGKNPWVSAVLMIVPLFNIAYLFWIASLPHKSVLEQLDLLTNQVIKLREQPSQQNTQGRWKCACGKIHPMDSDGCPECGIKRDFVLKKTVKKD